MNVTLDTHKSSYLRRQYIGLAIGAIVLSLTRVAAAQATTTVQCQVDATNLITTCIFERDAADAQAHFDDFAVPVASGYIAVGGGVEGAEAPGNLLTASYPRSDLAAWVVSTKDHVQPGPAKIKAYAIGLSIAGLTREDLLTIVRVQASTSDFVQHPDASVAVDPGFVMLGGGFRTDYQGGPGNLATASFPDTSVVWHAQSKDHELASPAYLTVYAIGIQQVIPGYGELTTSIRSNSSGVAAHPSSTTIVTPGFALTGCGAYVHWSGAGNLLWKLVPRTSTATPGCTAASKDHDISSPASITSYSLGVTFL
jgi:vibriolysin